MQNSGTSGKNPIKEIKEPRARKPKLERVSHKLPKKKSADEELDEAWRKWQRTFDAAKDSIMLINSEFKVVQANLATSHFLGKPLDEIVGRTCWQIVHGMEQAPTVCPLKAAKRTREHEEAELYISENDMWIEASVKPILDDKGNVSSAVHIIRDITERKKAEKELKRSKEFLTNIINALDDPVFVKDQRHRWVVLNNAACETTGRSREELIGKSDYDLFSKEQADVFWEKDELVFETGETNVNEEEITWHGKLRTISTKKSVFTDSLTGKKFIAGIIRDITDRKRAEERIHEQSEFLINTIESLNHPFYVIDANDYTIKVANAAVSGPGALPEGITCYALIHRLDKPCASSGRRCPVEGVKKTRKPVVLEHTHYDKDGSKRIFEVHAYPVLDEQGDVSQVIEYTLDITERKQAEEAYRALVDHSLQGLAIFQDGRVVFANQTMADITGCTVEEMLAKSPEQVQAFVHPDDGELVWSRHRDRLNGEVVPERYEFRGIRKDGSTCWLELHASRIEYQGKPAIQAAYVDITERKQAEEALRESEEYYRMLAETMNDGLEQIDENGRYVYVNKKFGRIMGYSPDEIVGKHWTGLHDKDAQKIIKEQLSKRKKGASEPYEIMHTRKDGGRIFIRISPQPIFDMAGNFKGSLAIFSDITELKKAEEEIRKFKTICDRAGYGVAMSDVEGNLIYVNRSFAQMHGYTADELIGKNLSLFHNQEQMKNVNRLNDKLRREGSFIAEEVWHKREDDTVFPTLMHGTLIRDEKRKPLFMAATAVDITERKRAEQELLEDQAQLKSLASQLTLAEERERRRIATKLHDRISQSLVISKMNLETLRKSGHGEEFNRTLDEICNSLGQTIQDTRTLTFDLSSPILYELGFEAAVDEWLTEQIQDKHGIASEFEDDGQSKPLNDDIRILLFRDVRELLINVVRHAHAHKVKVSIRKVGKQMQVSVEDDGMGFDPAEAASTAAKRAEFGLFSIRQRLEELGGSFEIKSEPGRGCKVTMTAPLKQEG